MTMHRTFLISAFFSLSLIGLGFGGGQDPVNSESSPRPLVAIQSGPEFSLWNVLGGEVNSSELKGKVVVVEFWATWALPSQAALSEYNVLRKKLKDRGVEFLAVTFESGSVESIVPVLKRLQVEIPVAIGTDEIDHNFGGHIGYPTTFVIGKDWKVYRKIVGAAQNKISNLEKDIQFLLNQTTVP